MGQRTAISWTHHTFNPWWGCDPISPACDHCYARTWAKRVGMPELWNGARRFFSDKHWNEPLATVPLLPRVGWVIVGGETGGGARFTYVKWVRSIVRQCREARCPCFVKQLGAKVLDRNDAGFDGCEPTSWPPRPGGGDPVLQWDVHGYVEDHQGADIRIVTMDRKGADMAEWPEDLRVREFPQRTDK